MPVAVEVAGPWHFVGGSHMLAGATLLKHRQLRHFGWRVVSIPYWEWNALSYRSKGSVAIAKRQKEYLRAKLEAVNFIPVPQIGPSSSCHHVGPRARERSRRLQLGGTLQTGEEAPRRAQAPQEELQAWHEAWRERMLCWWLGLPTPSQQQLGACLGALGLHLASRFDAAWRASRVAFGRNMPSAPQLTAAAQPERGCEWLSREAEENKLELPEFPAFSETDIDLMQYLPLIPRLVPSYETLNALAMQQRPQRQRPQRLVRIENGAGGAAAALAAGALVAALWFRCSSKRRQRRGRIAMRSGWRADSKSTSQ